MATLYDIYKNQGKALPNTVEARFADPSFASAAQQAGITKDQYQINSGNAAYNTKIADLYGKTPAAPVAPVNPKAPVVPIYKPIEIPVGSFEDPKTKEARDAVEANIAANIKANSTPDDTIAKFQAQIDATNAMYADELARAKVAGGARLGTQTAVTGRRGLLGSDFGNAQIDTQENANETVYKSVENERLTKIAQIMSKAREDSTAAMKAKREALTADLDSRLKFYTETDSRKQDQKTKAIKSLLASGVSPKEIDPNSLSKIASYYGVSTEDITAGYDTEKKAYDANLAKENKGFELSEGQSRYEYDTKTGQYKQIANAPKTITPKASSSTTTKAPPIATQKTLIQNTLKTGVAPSGDKLGNPQGKDGYADPGVYLEALNNWGGTTKDFLNYFPVKTYVNPASYKILPESVRPSAKLPGSTKSTTATGRTL